MAKTKVAYVCQNCGYDSPQWIGKCSSCNQWNTMVEEIVTKQPTSKGLVPQTSSKPVALKEVELSAQSRMGLFDQEFNRVLGGGLVPGSIILLGGEPGIGKSTLTLQSAMQQKSSTTLYISGEESAQQIKMRAERIGEIPEKLIVLTSTSTTEILNEWDKANPDVVIIDSIQTLHSSILDSTPGSVGQIRQCTSELLHKSKTTNVPCILIGHINKEGSIAGPKILEHMVDVVLQFEGDRNHVYRILRAVKNRFGSTNELGIYEMNGNGLQEVPNPSKILLGNADASLSGTAVAATIEGLRPMLVEIQALVSTAVYGTPQRSATGFDLRRMNMLLAVLEKRCGFKLGMKDVFLNMAGGLKIEDPAVDLAVVAAIMSSNADLSLPGNSAFAAEIGLSGELRPVNRVEQRVSEAAKMGFERIFISSFTKGIKGIDSKLEIVTASKIQEVFTKLF